MPRGHEEDEEEFVLLDLDVLSGNFQVPPNAPYVFTVCCKSSFWFFCSIKLLKVKQFVYKLMIFGVSLSLFWIWYILPLKSLSFEFWEWAKQIKTVYIYPLTCNSIVWDIVLLMVLFNYLFLVRSLSRGLFFPRYVLAYALSICLL